MAKKIPCVTLNVHISLADMRHCECVLSVRKITASTVLCIKLLMSRSLLLPPGPMDSILASVIKADEAKKTKAKDLSIYRTPSGNDNEQTEMY